MRQPRVDRLRVDRTPGRITHTHAVLALPSQPAHLDLVTVAFAFLSGLLILS